MLDVAKNEGKALKEESCKVTEQDAPLESSISFLEQQSSLPSLESSEVNSVFATIVDEDFHLASLPPSEPQPLIRVSKEFNQIKQLVIHQHQRIENQHQRIENQNQQIEALKCQVENLNQELYLSKTTLSVNVVIHDEDTQRLIARNNKLKERMQKHHGRESLLLLSDCLAKDLRKYCEDRIPMASGMYLPHHSNKLSTETTHEIAHLAEYFVHEAAHPIANYFPSLKYLIGATEEVMNQVPLLSFVLGVYDIISSHQFIHKAEHTVGKLRAFSADQRNLLYYYVTGRTLFSLATRIITNVPINHPVAKKHPLSGSKLYQWYILLLTESISSLAGLHSIRDINCLATDWSKSLVHKFLQPGVDMSNSQEINQVRRYSRNDLKTVLKVQRIFTEPMSNSSQGYLAKSLEGITWLDDFYYKLYHKVLLPYKRCANRWGITALFTGYSPPVHKTLQKWQSRFLHALDVINEELRPLKEQGGENSELQQSLSKACLFGNLQGMCSDMPWHMPANRLFLEMSNQNLDCTREPLKITDDNEIELITARALLDARAAKAENELAKTKEELAKAENENAKTKEKLARSENENAKTKEDLARSENENAKTKEELIKANARSDTYKARAGELEVLVLKNEQTITLLERAKTTSQQSSLIENSLFRSSAGAKIEGNEAEFSNNSTLQ